MKPNKVIIKETVKYFIGLWILIDGVWNLGEGFIKNKIVKEGMKVLNDAGEEIDVLTL